MTDGRKMLAWRVNKTLKGYGDPREYTWEDIEKWAKKAGYKTKGIFFNALNLFQPFMESIGYGDKKENQKATTNGINDYLKHDAPAKKLEKTVDTVQAFSKGLPQNILIGAFAILALKILLD